jgi:glycosyltransferase involved in cell wall biosynthesis
VTTDSVGCRETVDHGRNGYLVPPRNAAALATALGTLLSDPQKRAELGRQSRLKAEREFDERLVVRRVLGELYGVPTNGLGK